MLNRNPVLFSLLATVLVILNSTIVHGAIATFTLDNVMTDRGSQLTGEFTWIYAEGDFENGVGQFTSLDVPHTTHELGDL